jgi:hypothetical protein
MRSTDNLPAAGMAGTIARKSLLFKLVILK